MSIKQHTLSFTLTPSDNKRLANLCGECDSHLRQIEREMGVEINVRGNAFYIIGPKQATKATESVLKQLFNDTENDDSLNKEQVHLVIQEQNNMPNKKIQGKPMQLNVFTKHGPIKPRGYNQQLYLESVQQNDINFGIGPAGTGKTYLAVAAAVDALQKEQVERILLVRPAVEAGERLGFLPGDLSQKVDPYLKPLYDALHEMMGFAEVNKCIEREIIEIAPLAYMRGRTLNDAFIILDEGQNTTIEQMKMFLTRIGFNAKAIITGDVTQIDLPKGQQSGLRHVVEVLKDTPEISFTFFNGKDVVRHPLVQKIIEAYESHAS